MLNRKIKAFLSAAVADVMLMTSGFTAFAGSLGDINSDSAINAVDASEILSEYARVSTNQAPKFTEAQKKAADVDNNGAINAVDASQVLSYYAYKSTSGTMEFEDYLKNPPPPPKKEPTIVGSWLPVDDENNTEGIAFTDDGYISMFFYSSENFSFRADGIKYQDTVYPYSSLVSEGDYITLNSEDKVIFEMKRITKGDGYNGTYKVTGGELHKSMLWLALLSNKNEIGDMTMTVNIDGENSEIWINKFLQYKVNGNTFEVVVPEDAEGDNKPIEFTVDEDTLTIKNEKGSTTMKRVK